MRKQVGCAGPVVPLESAWGGGLLATRALLLLLLLSSTGCERYAYRPRAAAPVETRDVRLALSRVRFLPTDGEDFQLELDVEAPAGSRLTNAWLADERSPPCAQGLPLRTVRRDGQRVGVGPLPLGPRDTLQLEFPRAAAWKGPLATGARLDVSLEEGACVQVPVSHPPEGWVLAEERFSMGLGARSQVLFSPVADVQPRLLAYVDAGRWFGPVRLGLELGGGVGSAQHVLLEVAPTLSGVLWQQGIFALGVSGAYPLLLAGPAESRSGDGDFWLHGPRAGLRLLLAVPPEMRPGFPGGARMSAAGLELQGGYLMRTAGAPTQGSGMLGLSLVLEFGV